MLTSKITSHGIAIASVSLLFAVQFAMGAVFYVETFDTSVDNWINRPGGSMTDGWNALGNPGGSYRGSFAAQGFASPQTDAWRANSGSSGGKFTGDYWALSPAFTGFRFDFYAADFLPSDLTLRFGSGANVFSLALLPLNVGITATGVWYTVGVPLDYSYPWVGNPALFSSALSNVTFVDVQISRNASKSAQNYYLDNFGLVNDLIFVPEPASGLFWFGWALVFGGLRRKLAGRRERSPYALPAARR